MTYDFDQVIDRHETSAIKIEKMNEIWGREDLIPLWVADMDFATPPFVLDAVRHRCEHPILGYTAKPESYFCAVADWVNRRYAMGVDRHHINYVPGIVAGLGMAINCFSKEGDGVMIMPPAYTPFSWLTTRNRRRLVECPLRESDGRYRMDLELIRSRAKEAKLLILCNPHNPGGVVWQHEELEELARICAEAGVLVLSDEIHADLTLPPHRHLPFACVSDLARQNSVTFMAPSKTFNMPGMTASQAIIFNDDLRSRFEAHLEAGEFNMGHVFAFDSVAAAYNHGEEWLAQCLDYIQANIEFVDDYLSRHTPLIRAMRPEASFLVWLDCRAMGLSHDDLIRFFVDEAHLAINDGETFGKEGAGFMRLNVATPRSILRQAMEQLGAAYAKRF